MTLSTTDQNRLNKLKELVTLRVDEYSEQAQNPFPEIPTGDIEYELGEAAKSLTRKLDRGSSFLASRSQTGIVPIQDEDKGSTILPLADDFLRFVQVKMKGWKQAATEFVRDTSPVYRQQIYEHRRAGVEKPVAAMIPFLDSFDRYYEQNRAKYSNTDPVKAASQSLTLSGWAYTTSRVTITVDGVTLYLGGFATSGNLTGAQAAQTLADMLNGEFVDGATGYNELPTGYVASYSSNVLKIARTTAEYKPISLVLSDAFSDQITVTATASDDGFSAAPVPGDVVRYNNNDVGTVLSVDTATKEAILDLDEVYLSVGNALVPVSGKYDLTITALTSETFKGTTKSKRALEVFPAGDSVESLLYVPYLKAYEFPEEYEDALVWSAVANVLLIMRQGELAGNALKMAEKSIIEINGGIYGEDG